MMNARFLALLCAIALSAPSIASATVRISEIAWMGIPSNANAEWIELENTGSESVPLSGWSITSSSGTPTITLSGTIPANSFFLLTRTSVTTVPGVLGDQVYTGALSNAGATLTLSDGAGVIDEVVGGLNWEDIGGDNVTKKTPQRSDTGWVTATPTPKAPNAAIAGDATDDGGTIEDPGETGTTTPEATIGGTSVTSGVVAISIPKLYIAAGPNRVVSTGAETAYVAHVYDEKGRLRKHAEVSWSFGDGVRETGSRVGHAYRAPGTYALVVRATNEEMSALRVLTVEVVDAKVSIGTVSNTGIELVNTGDHLVDLSGWQLSVGTRTFKIPPDTALFPGGRAFFPSAVTRLSPTPGNVTLRYPGGEVAADIEPASVEVISERAFSE